MHSRKVVLCKLPMQNGSCVFGSLFFGDRCSSSSGDDGDDEAEGHDDDDDQAGAARTDGASLRRRRRRRSLCGEGAASRCAVLVDFNSPRRHIVFSPCLFRTTLNCPYCL
jgi:hypothetical protein